MVLQLDEIDADIESLRTCGYEVIIAGCKADALSYVEALVNAAAVAKGDGRANASAALNLLAAACQPILQPSKPMAPFGPLFEGGGRHGVIPADFGALKGALLAELALEVADFELGARLADLGWSITRNVVAARFAVNAYIWASNSPYCRNKWFERTNRLERALRIALQLKDSGLAQKATVSLLGMLETGTESEIPPGVIRICQLLLEQSSVDVLKMGERVNRWATLARAGRDYQLEHSLLNLAARAYLKARDKTRSDDARLAAAEALVKAADTAESSGQNMVAHHWLSQAIGGLQKCPNQKERVCTLQLRLASLGKASLQEMGRIEIPLDGALITKTAAQVAAAMQGKDLTATLLQFACLIRPLQREQLEAQVQKLVSLAPLTYRIAKVAYNGDGRVVARIPPFSSSTDEDGDIALKAACYQQAKIYYLGVVPAAIIPARDELLQQHQIDARTLAEFLERSALFPLGRGGLWVKGFMAGFEGDFVAALSILIPQFEHALRKTLEVRGAVVYRIDPATSAHSEKSLGDMLGMAEAKEFLGEDLQFELQCLLTEQVGQNLRNELAHGLLSEEAFHSAPAVYVWWLFLHIAVALINRDSTQLP
ncbi:MAG: DUF4209 domain-containing protein [Gammaproteobacteria bacterium]|nr:DUF4209 domain-containing protein [Gammaproteobacteria bacterium]